MDIKILLCLVAPIVSICWPQYIYAMLHNCKSKCVKCFIKYFLPSVTFTNICLVFWVYVNTIYLTPKSQFIFLLVCLLNINLSLFFLNVCKSWRVLFWCLNGCVLSVVHCNKLKLSSLFRLVLLLPDVREDWGERSSLPQGSLKKSKLMWGENKNKIMDNSAGVVLIQPFRTSLNRLVPASAPQLV